MTNSTGAYLVCLTGTESTAWTMTWMAAPRADWTCGVQAVAAVPWHYTPLAWSTLKTTFIVN